MTDKSSEFLDIGSPKDGVAAVAVFVVILAIGYKTLSSLFKNEGGGLKAVTQEQLEEVKKSILRLADEVEKFQDQVFSQLDDLVLIDVSAQVFGVAQALKIYDNLNDEIVAKGAFSNAVSNVARLEAILSNRPAYLTDKTFLTLETLHHISLAIFLKLSVLIQAQNITAEAISKNFDRLAKITLEGNEAAFRVARGQYELCGTGVEIEREDRDRSFLYKEFIGYRKKGATPCAGKFIAHNSITRFGEETAKYRALILTKLDAMSREESDKLREEIQALIETLEQD